MKVVVTVAVMFSVLTLAQLGQAETFTFDSDSLKTNPQGFTPILTGRDSNPGRWQVIEDADAPSRPLVVEQTSTDRTNARFPVLLADTLQLKNLTLSVAFKPMTGKVDQAAGLVWRYQDRNNYYVVRANALEDNVVLYKVHNGKRSDLDPVGTGLFAYGKKAKVDAQSWQLLEVRVEGNRFKVAINGQRLFEVVDATFTEAGQVGLWTKADSVTRFDDLQVESLD